MKLLFICSFEFITASGHFISLSREIKWLKFAITSRDRHFQSLCVWYLWFSCDIIGLAIVCNGPGVVHMMLIELAKMNFDFEKHNRLNEIWSFLVTNHCIICTYCLQYMIALPLTVSNSTRHLSIIGKYEFFITFATSNDCWMLTTSKFSLCTIENS